MAVYASKRQESKVQYLKVAQDLAIYTAKQVKKFPKAQRFIFADNIMRLALEIHEDVLRANAIYVHKDMSDTEYAMREEYLVKAKTSIGALSGLLTVTYGFISQGNNFLGDQETTAKIFEAWAELLNEEATLIKSVAASDRTRRSKKDKDGVIRFVGCALLRPLTGGCVRRMRTTRTTSAM